MKECQDETEDKGEDKGEPKDEGERTLREKKDKIIEKKVRL